MSDETEQTLMKPEDVDTRKLYRDCMRLSYHIAAQSAKGNAMRSMIRQSFKSNMHVEDTSEINKLKMHAILGIQNYVIHESTRKAIARRGKK